MQGVRTRERRQHRRYSLIQRGSPSQIKDAAEGFLATDIVNISRGGIRVNALGKLPVKEVLKCQLSFPQIPVPIPTLMQVQWCRKASGMYSSGLRFVI
jgi:hypothetical protein